MTRNDRRQLRAILLAGVGVRLAFLWWVTPLELWADEGQYVYQAVSWNHFGFYLGSPGWVWPPGYPAYLAPFLAAFGEAGIFAAKLGQVLLSGVVGGSIAWFAARLFSARAAKWAAAAWAVYLPLIGFTHYLWPETLFLAALLPALALFLRLVDGDARRPLRDALASGALIGVACLFKEAPLPLLAFLPAVLVAAGTRDTLRVRVGLAAVLVLAATAVLAPWSARTTSVYGRFAPSGATLGENMYQGWNAGYVNFDYAGAPAMTTVTESASFGRWFVEPPPDALQWSRSEAPNTLARNADNVARGKAFARAHPGFFVRSRIKKVADWFTPLNFFHRHHRLEVYSGSIASPWVRRALAFTSVAQTCVVLVAGLGGLFLGVANGRRRWTLLAYCATFLAGAAVVSMSRYRLPIEPLLIVLGAGWIAGRDGAPAPSPASRRLAWAAWAALGAAWLINLREILFIGGRGF